MDTYWIGLDAGTPEATLARAGRYRVAGADGVFVPGDLTATDIAALVGEIEASLNVLYRPGLHSVPELAALGVRRISTGSHLLRTALAATRATALTRDAEEPD